MFFNARYSKFHIGNFTEESFYDLCKSEHYWRVMEYLASPSFVMLMKRYGISLKIRDVTSLAYREDHGVSHSAF